MNTLENLEQQQQEKLAELTERLSKTVELKQIRQINNKITIDPEFKNLLRPLTDEEYDQLEKNLIRDGSPIITLWKGHNIIIDGHHSYQIAQKHNIPFTTREIELAERSDVINWMFDLQLGRRNLTEKEKSYYRAKQYNSLKKERGGDRGNQYTKKDASAEQGSAAREREATTARSVRAVEKVATQCSDRKHLPLANCHSDTMANPLLNKESTAQQVAQRTGVSERTINRDTKFAQDIDAIALKLNISLQEVIASDLTKKAVSELKDKPVEVIRKKLANPKAKPVRELPKLEIEQLVQIKSDRTNKDLVGYNKSYAVVKKLNRNCADIDVWGKLLTDVHLQFLYPVEDKVAICANVSPEFLLSIMANYESFDTAVTQIPINKYHQGEKVKVISSYRKDETGIVTQALGSTQSNVMFADGTVEIFENRNLSSFVDS